MIKIFNRMPLRQLLRITFYPLVVVALLTLAITSYNFQSSDFSSIAHCSRRWDEISKSANPIKSISFLCNCRKETATTATNLHTDPDVFDWCSRESTVRGPNQKVIFYTLYGDAKNASIFNRYYSLLRNISLTAQRDYPGWIIRIYHDVPDERTSKRSVRSAVPNLLPI